MDLVSKLHINVYTLNSFEVVVVAVFVLFCFLQNGEKHETENDYYLSIDWKQKRSIFGQKKKKVSLNIFRNTKPISISLIYISILPR